METSKKTILSIGGSGLVGSRVRDILENAYNFEDASRTNGLNITDKNSVLEKIKNSLADIVIQFAAKADVDGCEADKEIDLKRQKGQRGQNEENTAWAINVLGTRNVAEACEELNRKLIYISTDFIFGGKEPNEGGFVEDDIPNPLNWYGQTKYEGEKFVQAMRTPWVIIRPAYPYRANFEQKKDFVRVFLHFLKAGKPLKLITDHLNNPTLIDDIAVALGILIQKNQIGIFHVTGSQTLSPYEEGLKISEAFGLDKNLISRTTRAEYFAGKAHRPFSLAMNNDRIKKLGVRMRGFEEGLQEIKRQIEGTN